MFNSELLTKGEETEGKEGERRVRELKAMAEDSGRKNYS